MSAERRITILKGVVYLRLPNGKARNIGWIENMVFHCFRKPEKHLMKKYNSYGFNYELMALGGFNVVAVHQQPGEILRTWRNTILDWGKFYEFKKQGFEKQIFLVLEDFHKPPMTGEEKLLRASAGTL